MAVTVESPPATASSPQGSSSSEGFLFKFHRGPTNARLSFPTPTIIGMKWACAIELPTPHEKVERNGKYKVFDVERSKIDQTKG